MLKYADYSGGRPSGAALKAAGFAGVVRYVGVGSSGKRITSGEYRDLAANQLDVLLVIEGGTADVAGGYNAGVANATAGLQDARNLGIPDSVPIAVACDSHVDAATGVTAANAVAYARGAASVLGAARTGFYGFSDTLVAVHAAGVVNWYWLCGSTPSSALQGFTNLWQDNTQTQSVAGVTCDVNWLYNPLSIMEADLTPEEHDLLVQTNLQLTSLWNQLGKKTLVDGLSAIGTNQDTYHADLVSRLAKIPTTAASFTDAQVAAVAAAVAPAVESAIKASGVEVDANSIAQAVVALLASKISGSAA